jgi:hypothetical protein
MRGDERRQARKSVSVCIPNCFMSGCEEIAFPNYKIGVVVVTRGRPLHIYM